MNKKTLIAAVTLVLGMATLFISCEADSFHNNTQDGSAGLIKDVDVDEPNVELPSSSSGEMGYCVLPSGTCLQYTEDNCDNVNGDFVTKCPTTNKSSSSTSSSSSGTTAEYVSCYVSSVECYGPSEGITAAICTVYSGTVVASCDGY